MHATHQYIKIVYLLSIILLFLIGSSSAYARIIFVDDDVFENGSEIFQIGSDDDATTNILSLEFGGINSESITWDMSAFKISDDLSVQGDISQDGQIITLDSDNTGVGADVDIIANQGSDNDGILRYNATDNRWEISNNGDSFDAIATGSGGGTVAMIGVFYDSAGGLDVNVATPVAIPWNQETKEDTGITHDAVTNNSRVYMDSADWYRVTYSVSHEVQSGTRNIVRCQVRLNGSTYVVPSDSYSYSRSTTDKGATNNATVILETTAGNEYYEIMCNGEGTGVGTAAVNTIASQSWTTVEKAGALVMPNTLDDPIFTLDNDNVGAGINVDIVANQGSDNDGILRYNATTNRWQISNDGGSYNDVHIGNIFYAYDDTGGQAITGTEITLNLDNEVFSDDDYTLSTDEITINETGVYKITLSVSTDDIDTTGENRATTEIRLQEDPLGVGAFADIPGAVTYCYHRETVGNTCNLNIVQMFSATDIMRVRLLRIDGATNMETEQDASRIIIERIR